MHLFCKDSPLVWPETVSPGRVAAAPRGRGTLPGLGRHGLLWCLCGLPGWPIGQGHCGRSELRPEGDESPPGAGSRVLPLQGGGRSQANLSEGDSWQECRELAQLTGTQFGNWQSKAMSQARFKAPLARLSAARVRFPRRGCRPPPALPRHLSPGRLAWGRGDAPEAVGVRAGRETRSSRPKC